MKFATQLALGEQISEEYLQPDSVGGRKGRVSIESLTLRELDSLPFGAIQLDPKGTILQYNDYESRLAGVDKSRAIGKNFFTDVAPCTNVREFRGRFTEGVAKKKLHEKFRYHFAFKKNPQDVTVTLYYNELTNTTWIFIRTV